MSRTHKDQQKRGHAPKPERHISVRGVRRDPPDYRKLARALIAIAQAEVEAEAEAHHELKSGQSTTRRSQSDETPPEAA